MNTLGYKEYHSALNWYPKLSGVQFNNIVRKCKQIMTDLDRSHIASRQLVWHYKKDWSERMIAYATCKTDIAPEEPRV